MMTVMVYQNSKAKDLLNTFHITVAMHKTPQKLPDFRVSFYISHDFSANVKVKWMMGGLWKEDGVKGNILQH